MDEYFVRSVCEDCGHGYAIILYHICDKMDDPKHDTCTDECNPDEMPFIPRYHNEDSIAVFYRCAKCDSLNTEKQFE